MKRRDFIQKTAVAGAAAFVLPRFSIGQPGPSANSKMNIAMIGVGGIAGMAFDGCQNENIVALCDIALWSLWRLRRAWGARGRGREHANVRDVRASAHMSPALLFEFVECGHRAALLAVVLDSCPRVAVCDRCGV